MSSRGLWQPIEPTWTPPDPLDAARAALRIRVTAAWPTMVPTDTQGDRHDDGTRSSFTDSPEPADGA